ncbi:MAG: UvrD-helicase domain-containing protein [Fusobacteriaceae bacterium]
MERIILKASAGTGKTYRLSIEYLSALLKGQRYKDIVVMTFTKKATSEIKERIINFLKIISYSGEEIELDFKEKNKEKKEILEKIKEHYKNIEIDELKIKKIYNEIKINSDRMKIYTIDGFINTIFKTAIAPSLGLSTYEIVDEDENNEIFNRLFEKIFKNKESFEIFKSFLESNTEKNLENYLDIIKMLVNSRWKMILLEESKLNKDKNLLGDGRENNFHIHYRETMDILLKIVKLKKGELGKLANGLTTDYISYTNLIEDDEIKDYLLKNYKLFFKKDTFPWNKTIVKSTKAINLLEEEDTLLESYEIFKKKLGIYLHDNEILKYEKLVLHLIEELYKNYDEIKFREGKLSHNDISNYTFKYCKEEKINLLDVNGITSYFNDIFDSKISTLFIDEFQDTSILQWKLLKAVADKADKVICVGDEKQSIYSWRGGEKKLFEDLKKILNGKEETLDKCYRSKKSIIEFTNNLFKNMSDIYNDTYGSKFKNSWNFNTVTSYSSDSSYIEIVNANEDTKNDAEPYEKIITILKSKFSGNYKNVAIIGRSNKDLEIMSLYLSEEGIPFILESNENIFKHRINNSTFKFIKYLVYDDYFLLLEFLRSDLIKINSKHLKFLLERKNEVIDYLNETIDINIKSKIEGIDNKLLLILDKIKLLIIENKTINYNTKNLIVKIMKSFGALEEYKEKTDVKNFYRLLEIAKEYNSINELVKEEEGNPTNNKFKQVAVEEKNAIILITVHKSKGLEYDTVFYLYKNLGKKGGLDNSNLDFTVKLNENYDLITNFLILNTNYKGVVSYLQGDYVYIDLEESKVEQEKLNVLYVGLTRAKNNIFLVMGKCVKNDSLTLALNNFEQKNGEFLRPEHIKDEIIEKKKFQIKELDFCFPSFDLEELKMNSELIEEKFKLFTFSAEEKRLIGTAVHGYLENILYNDEEEKEKAKKKIYSNYASEVEGNKLKLILNSVELENSIKENIHIFSKEWDYIYSEYEVMLNKESKRIDRLMIKKAQKKQKGKILIVDYKTGIRDDNQLVEYKKAIENHLEELGVKEDYLVETEFMTLKLPKFILK